MAKPQLDITYTAGPHTLRPTTGKGETTLGHHSHSKTVAYRHYATKRFQQQADDSHCRTCVGANSKRSRAIYLAMERQTSRDVGCQDRVARPRPRARTRQRPRCSDVETSQHVGAIFRASLPTVVLIVVMALRWLRKIKGAANERFIRLETTKLAIRFAVNQLYAI